MTLGELLEQNKDKFVNGRLKVRQDFWSKDTWFEVCAVSSKAAVGFYQNEFAYSCPLNTRGVWSVYTEPKPKKKLWPFVEISEDRTFGKTLWIAEGITPPNSHIPVPSGEPIEVDE